VVDNLNLSLTALNDIINAGTIQSAGNLTMTAGGSIVNALPAGAAGPSPVIQAAQNLNLNAANIVNSGLMAALANNINIASATAQNLTVNNVGGTLQALAGSINAGDALSSLKSNISILGGDLLSRELNIYGGTGTTNISVSQISGLMNISAGEAHTMVSSGSLNLGNLLLTGDPTFYHTSGPITINGDIAAGDRITCRPRNDRGHRRYRRFRGPI
jgi:hypothetical protein